MSQVQTTLLDVISRVLADLAMMIVEKPAKWPKIKYDLIGHIAFDGQRKGYLYIRCFEEFAKDFASNLLGVPKEDITEAEQLDAIGELLNVVCGNIVTDIFDSKAIFSLTPPLVEWIVQGEEIPNKDKAETLTVLVDEHPVEFTLIIEN